MYKCFKLSLDLWTFKENESEFVEKYREYGNKIKEEIKDLFEPTLNKAIDENGTNIEKR